MQHQALLVVGKDPKVAEKIQSLQYHQVRELRRPPLLQEHQDLVKLINQVEWAQADGVFPTLNQQVDRNVQVLNFEKFLFYVLGVIEL